MLFSEMLEKVKAGEIDPGIPVVIDNDHVGFYRSLNDEDFDAIEVDEGERGPGALLEAALLALGFTNVSGA